MLKTLTPEQRHSLGMAATRYSDQVGPALPYLQGRGVAHLAEPYLLGYVADPLPGDEQYVGRLSLPYITPAGVVDIRYRCLKDHDCKDSGCAKYLGRAGVETLPFNVMALQVESSAIAICEGEIDTLTMSMVMPAIGIPGAQAWKRWYPRMLADYDRVYVMCDGDGPGWDLGREVVKHVDEAVAVHLPDKQDVNSLYAAAGLDALRNLIRVAA